MKMINYDFIYTLEGGLRTEGYVPKKVDHDHSGVTIGAGFDLGQWPKAYIDALPISEELKLKLLPYMGMKGDTARYYLFSNHLSLTEDEAKELMGAIAGKFTANLSRLYQTDAGVDFDSTPDAAQTVIASVAWQYGNINVKCPHFWGAAIEQDWPKCIEILRDFGDSYTTRRKKEADYMEAGLNG